MRQVEGMHWADITAALYKCGSSPTEVARQEGIKGRGFVNEVIRGKKTSKKVAFAISAITGIPTEKMWPGRYHITEEHKKVSGNDAEVRASLKKAS